MPVRLAALAQGTRLLSWFATSEQNPRACGDFGSRVEMEGVEPSCGRGKGNPSTSVAPKLVRSSSDF